MSNKETTVSTVHFTFERHVPLLVFAVAIVTMLLLICNIVVSSLHTNQLVNQQLEDDEARLNIKRIWANDMTAFTGAVAALATLTIALVDELPIDAQLVLAFVAASLTVSSTYYFIVANRSDATATYIDINRVTERRKK